MAFIKKGLKYFKKEYKEFSKKLFCSGLIYQTRFAHSLLNRIHAFLLENGKL